MSVSREEITNCLRVAVESPRREVSGDPDDDGLFLNDANGSPGFDD